MKASKINPTGELPAGLPAFAAAKALNERDGFDWTPTDQQTWEAYSLLPAGHFLIDREGIIRWLRVEGDDGIDSICTFPSAEGILAAARRL